jgi:hypothetical protein
VHGEQSGAFDRLVPGEVGKGHVLQHIGLPRNVSGHVRANNVRTNRPRQQTTLDGNTPAAATVTRMRRLDRMQLSCS